MGAEGDEPAVLSSEPALKTLSVVIPCLNEEGSIEACVAAALGTIRRSGRLGEVVVSDNGSEDASARLAAEAGARVISEPARGYGNAYRAGFAAAQGNYVVMADADGTYDFSDVPRFLAELDDGADMVVGDRMRSIEPGAMPWLHRYIGNPLLSSLLNVLFRTGVRDAHCGMRAFRRDQLERLALRTSGMEFASEMVVRAAQANLNIRQIPIRYHPRHGESKLSSFRDGWRHLRFLLLHSPNYLFILPGLLMAVLGALISLAVLARVPVLQRQWDLHTLIGGSLLMIVGCQLSCLGLCAHAYATDWMGRRDAWFDRARERFTLEHGLAFGSVIVLAGVLVLVAIILAWAIQGFGNLSQERAAIWAATLLVIGLQVTFSSFLLSILGMPRD